MKTTWLLARLAPACLALAACTAQPRTEPAPDPHAEAAVQPFEVIAMRFASALEIAEILERTVLSSPATRVIADTRTNSIVIQGPDQGRAAARELIEKLDVETRR